jgi:hypothetical protein
MIMGEFTTSRTTVEAYLVFFTARLVPTVKLTVLVKVDVVVSMIPGELELL